MTDRHNSDAITRVKAEIERLQKVLTFLESNSLNDIPLTELFNLRNAQEVTVYHCLLRGGLKTVGDLLAAVASNQIKEMRNMGRTRVSLAIEILRRSGYGATA